MGLPAEKEPKRRGRPPKLRMVPDRLMELAKTVPADAEGFLDFCDRLLLQEKAGSGQKMLGDALHQSQATVSRMIKAASWPARIRARILMHAEKFPPPILMRLARMTWRDQGRVAKDGRRRVMKSRMTLAAAVELIIEGRSPFAAAGEPAAVRARRMERLANEERSSRQATLLKLEKAEAEARELKKELSMDKFSAALRRVKELEAEVQRLAHVPGAEPVQAPKSENVRRTEEDVTAALNNVAVNIINWGEGLMLISARKGDVLDGVCDRIKLLSSVRFKNGRALCASCRSMIGG